MIWDKNIEPKSVGWYLCTVEEYGMRHVTPIYRDEWPKNNFYWMNNSFNCNKKLVACMKFPKPYSGEIIEDEYEQLPINIQEK